MHRRQRDDASLLIVHWLASLLYSLFGLLYVRFCAALELDGDGNDEKRQDKARITNDFLIGISNFPLAGPRGSEIAESVKMCRSLYVTDRVFLFDAFARPEIESEARRTRRVIDEL